MEQEIDNLETTYDICLSRGMYLESDDLDFELIKDLNGSCERNLKALKELSNLVKKDSGVPEILLRGYYSLLNKMIRTFILFDKVYTEDDKAANAFVCLKHPELEFEWESLETLRLRLNSSDFRGQVLSIDEYSRFKLQIDLGISTLKNKIDSKMKELQ